MSSTLSNPHQSDAERLESLLDSDEAVGAREFVQLIQRVGRVRPQIVLDLGARSYLFGLRQVFRGNDPEGLVEVARLGSLILDASGRHEQAIARLEQAAVLVGDAPVAQRSLVAAQAFLNAVAGEVTVASELAAVARSEGPDRDLVTLADLAGVSCIQLDSAGTEVARELSRSARDVGKDSVASSLMVQVTAALAARGLISDAREVGEELLDYSTQVGHRARQIDAEVALIGLIARQQLSRSDPSLRTEAEGLMNNHPLWKTLVSALRQEFLRGDEEIASETHSHLVRHYDWLNPGYHNAFDGLAAFGEAVGGEAPVVVATPAPPTLLSLPNILASAEAVAMGGTLRAAADWLVWLEGELPAEVITSLEWPSCRYRVEALLRLRVGQPDEAEAGLERSIGVCEERGDTIEAEIGRAQLAELRGDEAGATLAASRLRDVGIEASLFASAAARIAQRAARAGARLSIREAQVVGRVASGMSHKEIEAELGLPRRGASRAISSGYAKLGVKGRSHVAQVARERLIA